MADLRRKQSEPDVGMPAPRSVNYPGIKGQIPFTVGKVILTDAEKKVFRDRFNWREGDPIPNLANVVKAEATGERMTVAEAEHAVKGMAPKPHPENTKSFVPPEVISIENLTEEKRKEVETAISSMRAQQEAAAKEARQQPFIPRDPSIAKAQAVAQAQANEQAGRLAALRKQDEQNKFRLEDDRKDMAAPKRAAITRPFTAPPRVQPATPVEQEPESPRPPRTFTPTTEDSDTAAAPFQAGGGATLTNCQHCGWDLSKEDEIETTKADERTYVAAMLGGKRFVKMYDALGGAAKVTFRAMSSAESDLILHQLYLDGEAGLLKSPQQVVRRAQEYQLAICLQSVHSAGNAVDLPTIDQHEVDKTDGATGLPMILEWVYSTAAPQDTLRRIFLALYAKFDATLAKLEIDSEKSDFGQAIEESR